MTARLYLRGNQLRIMKNPADDPATTPRTDYHKFAFDSQSGDLAYAHSVSGAYNDLGYVPLISSMVSFESGWWSLPSYAFSGSPGSIGSRKVLATSHWLRTFGTAGSLTMTINGQNNAYAETAPIATKYLAWKLPGRNVAIDFPSSTGAVGRILKTPLAVRVPRAGYSVSDADPRNFILHESLRPCKIVAAGRISIPAGGGGVVVSLPGTMPGDVFVGGQFSVAGHPVLLPFIKEDLWSVEPPNHHVQFAIGSSSITFREKFGNAVEVSYYVVAEDDLGPTSGGDGSFIKSGVESGTTFLRIYKPGTTGSRFADVLVDSRWQSMPLIANGFVSAGSFGSPDGNGKATATVGIPSVGYAPLVLASWCYDGGLLGTAQGEGRTCFWWEASSISGPKTHSGISCYVRIADGLLSFEHYLVNPTLWIAHFNAPGAPGWSYEPRTQNFGFTGVRWYAFAIPQG